MARTKDGLVIPSKESQEAIISFSNSILTEHRRFDSYRNKMEAIDIAYARYKTVVDPETGVVPEQGIDAATTPVGVIGMASTTPPVVVSQVDSMVAYLADVFLSGTPIFPVVSSPTTRKWAEQLETLIDDHATLGGYARQILLFLRDGVKYNFSALEVEWASISQYSIVDDILTPGKTSMKKDNKNFNKLTRWDPYNTVWDYNVAPGDVAAEGDYAGRIQLMSRTKLKRFLQRLADDNEAFNVREALSSAGPASGGAPLGNYRIQPQVSNYISTRLPSSDLNWYSWFTGKKDSQEPVAAANNFEVFTFYARIQPNDFGLASPAPKTVQIWKFITVNGAILVHAKRILSAYDMLPVLFGQPLEDGLGYQTQSIAEGNIPFQQSAETLFNISFNAARRAVSDRALYDKDLIKESDINAPVAAAKIPVKSNSLDPTRRIQDAYYQIPFNAHGTEGAIESGMRIVQFGRELTGLNGPMQGQFQKGNKSVQEWRDTMGNADARLRLPALILEYQVFQPLKNIIKFNIFQFGDDIELVSQKTGDKIAINIDELRRQVLTFRVADGYSPKSKIASTDSLISLIQMLGQSQQLQVAYGAMLPNMFAHLAQLLGVRGLEEYIPQQPQQVAPEGGVNNGQA